MTKSVLEQLREYHRCKTLGVWPSGFGLPVVETMCDFTEQRGNERVTTIKSFESFRHQDGTFERATVEYPAHRQVQS